MAGIRGSRSGSFGDVIPVGFPSELSCAAGLSLAAFLRRGSGKVKSSGRIAARDPDEKSSRFRDSFDQTTYYSLS